MAQLFEDILKKGTDQGILPAKNSIARIWYRDQAAKIGKVNEASFFRDKSNEYRQNFAIGNMYLFYYDPKMKKELPYYDKVPLVFPINRAPGGFLGLNMHYLPLKLRASLMDALYDTVTNTRYDDSTKLKISYNILNGVSKFNDFKPTIKHYLTSQIRSRFIYIKPTEWDMALFLDIARFEKASQQAVWQESQKIIRGR